MLTTTLKKVMCVVCCGSNDEIKQLSGLSAADAEAAARRSTKTKRLCYYIAIG